MELILTKSNGKAYDITGAVTKVEWSGSASSAGRQLTVDYVNAPFDDFNIPTVSTGDAIAFTPDNTELFYGQFFGSEKSAAVGTITYTAFDIMKNLLESSGQYNFKNRTPEMIARMVCDDAVVPVRSLYPTGINIASLLCDDMTLFDIIMAAYTKAHKITGDKYYPVIAGRGFNVRKVGQTVAGFSLDDSENMFDVSIEETMDEIVNRVKIYNENGLQVGQIDNPSSLERYGTFQKIYKVEKGVNYNTAAKNLLKVKPKQQIKISCAGNVYCQSCNYVRVHDAATGLNGKYWITSDKHKWENGTYTMELELAFDSIMQEVDTD